MNIPAEPIVTIIHSVEASRNQINERGAHIREIDDLRKSIDEIEDWQTIQQQTETILSAFLSQLLTRVQEISDIYNSVVHNKRISQHGIAPQVLAKKVEIIRKEAQQLGYELLVHTPADVMQSETSFISTPSGFVVFVHLPMAKKNVHMNLLRLVSVATQIGDELFVKFVPAKDVIAISKNNNNKHYKVMTMGELAACNQKGNIYLCERSNVWRNSDFAQGDNEDECMIHLINRNYDLIKKTCPRHLTGNS